MKIALIGYGKMGHMIEEDSRGAGTPDVLTINVDNTENFIKKR
jgi:pyrroline-5-carboxylate reductase